MTSERSDPGFNKSDERTNTVGTAGLASRKQIGTLPVRTDTDPDTPRNDGEDLERRSQVVRRDVFRIIESDLIL